MLSVERVTKRYAAHQAVSDVSFEAGRGEIIGLLGENGAGKSTLMNIITGYIAMTDGRVLVDGCDVQQDPLAARRRVGYAPEQPPLYPEMTVREYLDFCARLKGIARAQRKAQVRLVMERTRLINYENRLSRQLSKGYRQRLGVAQALLGQPPLLILDEPGAGLDPVQMAQMREVIREAGRTQTVLLSSHILGEVADVCTRVVLLSAGRVCFEGTMAQLLSGGDGVICLRLRASADLPALVCALRAIDGVLRADVQDADEPETHTVRITSAPGADVRAAVFALLCTRGETVLDMHAQDAGLEAAFLRVTGRQGEVRA